jgi:16S rRNA (guanine1207-N2)-methyltransferase
LLQSLPDFSDRKSLIDVGCGVGCIGICLKKAYPNLEVLMLDVNERCIELTKKNIENNKIEATVLKSSLYENVNGSYEIIISNPPIRAGKSVVHDIVLNGKNHLTNGGKIYVVIQKKQGAESCLKAMKEVYTTVDVIDKDNGYFIIKAIK